MSKRPIRCAHLISGDLWAGAEVATFHLLNELSERSALELHALVLNHGELADRLRDAGISTTVYGESTLSLPRLARQVTRQIAALRPDVVHSHRYKEHLVGALGAARAHAFHVRTAHGRSMPFKLNGGARSLGPLLDTLVASVRRSTWIAVSHDLAATLRGPRSQVAVIPNGLPDETPPAAPEVLDSAFEDHGPAWYIGFVGRLEPVKRPDRFVDVVATLPASIEGQAIRAVVVGDGSMASTLRARSERAGLEGRLRFLGHRTDSPSVIAALDSLVIPSDHEGLPMVMLEAMRSGTPIVASDVGGMAEALSGSGCLVPPETTALAARTLELLRDGAARESCSREVRARFTECGSIVRTADRVIDLYRTGVKQGA